PDRGEARRGEQPEDDDAGEPDEREHPDVELQERLDLADRDDTAWGGRDGKHDDKCAGEQERAADTATAAWDVPGQFMMLGHGCPVLMSVRTGTATRPSEKEIRAR